MKENEPALLLARVAVRVLEDGAFLFAEPLEERPPVERWRPVGAELRFEGPCSGAVRLWCDTGFAGSVAANMLGVPESSPSAAEKGKDALKELLNMVVGNFLTEWYGKETVFDLGLPVSLDPEVPDGDPPAENAVWLDVEGNVVVFALEPRAGERP